MFNKLEKGKSVERLRRKATGLRLKTMMAVLPKIEYILGGMSLIPNKDERELDKEWVNLIQEALEIGMTVEEIKQFLNNPETINHDKMF